MEAMCRACLALLAKEAHNLFLEKDLAVRFVECTSLTVDLNDNLPESLCDNCHEMVLKFNGFREMCAESVAKFRNLVEEIDDFMEDAVHGNAEKRQIEDIHLFNGGAPDSIEKDIPVPNNDSTDDNTLTETAEIYPKIDNQLLDGRIKSGSSFSCKICKKRFYKVERLRAHLRTHQGLKPYTCTECGRAYTRAENLRLHIREVHLDKRRSYKCTFGDCAKKYGTKRALAVHVLEKHTSPKKRSKDAFVCETCGKVFKRRAQLNCHRYTHMDESQYRFGCEYCSKRFYSKSSLEDHVKRHAQIKCFSCDICGGTKVSKAELKAHRKGHFLEKAFECTACDKNFSSSGNLMKHVRTVHEGVRNYACRFCDESFGRLYTLQTHEMRHTNTKPHKCQFCPSAFIQKGTLNTHIKRLHPEKAMQEI